MLSNRPCLFSVFAMDNTAAQRFDSTKFSGNPSENLVLSNRPCLLSVFAMDNTAAQRFDSTKSSERQPFRKFGAVEPPWIAQKRSGSIAPNFLKKTLHKTWCYRTAHVCCQYSQWITKQRSGSIAPNFLKENPSENLVLSNRPCLFSVFEMDNTAAQRFDSTKFSKRSPSENLVLSNRPCLLSIFAMDNTATQRFDNTKFMKDNPPEKLLLSNRPCLLSVFAMDNTAAQRFDSTKFSERQPFRNFGAFEPPWITQQRSGSIASNFLKENPSQNLVLSNRPCLLSVFAMDNTGSITPNL